MKLYNLINHKIAGRTEFQTITDLHIFLWKFTEKNTSQYINKEQKTKMLYTDINNCF